jgi:[ribosomal protein S5]-alanine N-acetyltransferase
MIVPPRLDTERLSLEPLGAHHSSGMFLLWSDDEVCRYSGGALDWAGGPIGLPATSPADSDKIIEFFERAARQGSGLRWAVVRRQDGEFLGAVGFNSFSPAAELAFHLRAEFWGHGFMREAGECALGWLQGHRPELPVEAFIEPGNLRSIGLARRLGFRATGTFAGRAQRYVLGAAPGQDRHSP